MVPTRKPQPEFEIRHLSPDEIARGIAQLRARIAEVEAIDPVAAAMPANNSAEIVASSVQRAILAIFGERSPEYREHQYIKVWAGSMWVNMSRQDVRQGIADGKTAVVAILQSLINRLESELSAGRADPNARARRAFADLDLNARIAAVAGHLYADGHYSQAVFEAAKALVNLVKERSGCHDLDGAGLMTTAFSVNKPLLAFNVLANQSDRDEQLGMMHLFEGAVLGIRNPGGHDFPELSPVRATQYIGFLSLLADRVAEARRFK